MGALGCSAQEIFTSRCVNHDRSDIDPNDEPNKELALAIDDALSDGHYLIVPIVDYDIVSGWIWQKITGMAINGCKFRLKPVVKGPAG